MAKPVRREPSFSLLSGAVQKASALEEKLSPAQEAAAIWIPIDQIQPGRMQYRGYFDEEFITNLAEAFRDKGFNGVINVRPIKGDKYEIVAGEQRWRAAKRAELPKIRCLVADFTDEESLEFSLFENVLRKETSKLENLEGILKLLQFRHKLEIGSEKSRQWVIEHLFSDGRQHQRCQAGRAGSTSEEWNTITEPTLKELGISIDVIHSWLRLLTIPEDIRQAHLENKLAYSIAIEIAKLQEDGDTERRKSKTRSERWRPLLDEAIGKGLSKRDVIARVKQIKAAIKNKKHVKSEKVLTQFETTFKRLQKMNDFLSESQTKRLQELLQEVNSLLDAPSKNN